MGTEGGDVEWMEVAVWMCTREEGVWVLCSTALAFSVTSPCPPKMTILRLCFRMAVCQISSFVSEA